MLKLFLVALSFALQLATTAHATDTTDSAQSIANTGWQMVRAVPSGNVVVSPASIWTALGMAYIGAEGDTASEMADVLYAPNQRIYFVEHAAAFHASLTSKKDPRVQLYSVNRIWIQRDWALNPVYELVLDRYYHQSAAVVDFRQDAPAARKAMNQWVAKQTRQRIKDLMPPDSVRPDTRMVLTNAMYFKAPWKSAFAVSATSAGDFYIDGASSVPVPLMQQTARAMVGRTGSDASAATVCELPYADGRFKMVLYVPDRVDGLNAVLEEMDQPEPSLEMQAVRISLPKWKAQQTFNLKPMLQEMGMQLAFDPQQADFSGMREQKDVFISDVVHKSMIEVSEAGTEAASASGLGMTKYSAETPVLLELKVDRPFAWSIVDTRTNTLLFAGVVRDPRS